MASKNELITNRSHEMDKGYSVAVTILGKVLEGHGKIHSELEDSQLEQITEAIKDSVDHVSEPDYSSCGDGRQVVALASGEPGGLRRRKFGGSLTPFNMMLLASPSYFDSVESATKSAEDLYQASDELSLSIGSKPSGHVDCGAGGGIISHNRTVAETNPSGPNAKAVTTLVPLVTEGQVSEAQVQEIIKDIQSQAARVADLYEARNWDGKKHIERLALNDPASVEVLHSEDSHTGGHHEKFIVLTICKIVGEDGRPSLTINDRKMKQLTGYDYFQDDLTEIASDASKLGKNDDERARNLTAALMHHVAGVAPNLTDGSLPVFLVEIS